MDCSVFIDFDFKLYFMCRTVYSLVSRSCYCVWDLVASSGQVGYCHFYML